MDQIKNSDRPVSGSALAKTFQVSRQVIVQDIALYMIALFQGYFFETVLFTISLGRLRPTVQIGLCTYP